MKINATWHLKHRMAQRATLRERARWHVAHAKHCGCRPIPASVEAYLRAVKNSRLARGVVKITAKSSTGRVLKRGSVVCVMAVPPAVVKQSPRDTRRLFKAMIGCRFKVRAINHEPVLLELEVSRVAVPLIGGSRHTVYIEPEFVA